MSRQRSNQSDWKRDCNRSQRRFNKQSLSTMDKENDDPKVINHYKEMRQGDIWCSPNDGYNWRRGRGHDKKKPWRD
jgi:hypothetical protein